MDTKYNKYWLRNSGTMVNVTFI